MITGDLSASRFSDLVADLTCFLDLRVGLACLNLETDVGEIHFTRDCPNEADEVMELERHIAAMSEALKRPFHPSTWPPAASGAD